MKVSIYPKEELVGQIEGSGRVIFDRFTFFDAQETGCVCMTIENDDNSYIDCKLEDCEVKDIIHQLSTFLADSYKE